MSAREAAVSARAILGMSEGVRKSKDPSSHGGHGFFLRPQPKRPRCVRRSESTVTAAGRWVWGPSAAHRGLLSHLGFALQGVSCQWRWTRDADENEQAVPNLEIRSAPD